MLPFPGAGVEALGKLPIGAAIVVPKRTCLEILPALPADKFAGGCVGGGGVGIRVTGQGTDGAAAAPLDPARLLSSWRSRVFTSSSSLACLSSF
eukprot:4644786-Amphidinium_carterae.1